MSQVLVTGAKGQLGREIKKLRNLFSQIYTFTDIEELDLTRVDAIENQLRSHPASYIINCAAYTDVDGAESDPEGAMLLNRDIVSNLAKVLEKFPETRLIHISTDYIFPGKLHRPIREDDTPDPLSVYGSTKLEGEKILHGTFPGSGNPHILVIQCIWQEFCQEHDQSHGPKGRPEGGL